MFGQMIISGFRGNAPEDLSDIIEKIKSYHLGGVILFDENMLDDQPSPKNILSPEQLKRLTLTLQTVSETPLFIAVDQEGGNVNRLKPEYGFPETKSWGNIGSLLDRGETEAFSDGIARTLKEAGINLNLAPVVDLATGPDSFVNKSERCFHENHAFTSEHAQIFIDCHRRSDVLTTLKHFPGIGSAKSDTHDGFTNITESWSPEEMAPFKKLIEGGKVDLVMVGHVFHSDLDPDWPASMSHRIVQGMLRNELGFEGVVISDDPSMGAISEKYSLDTTLERMVNAGIDLFCFGNNLIYDPQIIPKVYKTLENLVSEKRIPTQRIEESIARIQNLKSKLVI